MSKIGNHGDGGMGGSERRSSSGLIKKLRRPEQHSNPSGRPGQGHQRSIARLINPSSHDGYSLPWNFNDVYRRDAEQVDIAALMSALIDINRPINSVGVLPGVDPTRPGFFGERRWGNVGSKACSCEREGLLVFLRFHLHL